MEWKQVQSIKELQNLGKLKEVIQCISSDLPKEAIPRNSWANVYRFIQSYQDRVQDHPENNSSNVKPQSTSEGKDILEKHIFDTIRSINQLKGLGTFKEVKQQVIEQLGNEAKNIKGWEKLYQYIEEKIKKYDAQDIDMTEGDTQSVRDDKTKEVSKDKELANKLVQEVYASCYFKDEVSEMIFYLLELEGEERLKKLGINRRYYKEKELASKWKNKLIKKIHPDENRHEKAEEATKELNKLYRSMIQFAK